MADVQKSENGQPEPRVRRRMVVPVQVDYDSERPLPWRIWIGFGSAFYYYGRTMEEAWKMVLETETPGSVMDEIAEMVYFQGEIVTDTPEELREEPERNWEAEAAELRADREGPILDAWERDNEGRYRNYVPDEEGDPEEGGE